MMRKKKVVFISFTDFANPVLSGLMTKMNAQCKAFRDLGFETESLFLSGKKVVNDRGDFDKRLSGFPLRNSFFAAVETRLQKAEHRPDIIYIRYPFSTAGFVRFLKSIRTHFPETKVVLEVPTYPYDMEFVLFQKWKLWVDLYFRKKLRKYVHLVVTYGNEEVFEGIQTIKLTNGTDITNIQLSDLEKEKIFTFAAVGNWRFWHGLDRFLYGMSEYLSQSPEENIQLIIIGDGEDFGHYKNLIKELKLGNYIRFPGKKTEEETIKIMQKAHVGVGVLGSHRKGLESHSPLKHRLYAVCGLPFVFSTEDPDFSGKTGFVYQFPPNEEPVSIRTIFDFYRNGSHESAEIIKFAHQQLSWKIRMEKVLDRLT